MKKANRTVYWPQKLDRKNLTLNCTPKVRQKKSNFWGVFIMKLTYEDKVGLTLACLNNKKLVKMIVGKNCYFIQISTILLDFERIKCEYKKDKYQKRCLSSFWNNDRVIIIVVLQTARIVSSFSKNIWENSPLSRQNVSYFSKSKKKHKKRLRESCLYIYF